MSYLHRKGQSLRRIYIHVLVVAGIIVIIVESATIHPHQIAYFNLLVDRKTLGYLQTQYEMDYWGTSTREGLEHLLKHTEPSNVYLHRESFKHGHVKRNINVLSVAERERVKIGNDFLIVYPWSDQKSRGLSKPPFAPLIHDRKVWGNTILAITALNPSLLNQESVDSYRKIYYNLIKQKPLIRSKPSGYDVYLGGNILTLIKDACDSTDMSRHIQVRIFPANAEDIDLLNTDHEFNILRPQYGREGIQLNNGCMLQIQLPHYPIRAMEVGEWLPDNMGIFWKVVINFSKTEKPTIRAFGMSIPWMSLEPVAKGNFDLYAIDNKLIYFKNPCTLKDLDDNFFLHIIPISVEKLPNFRQQYGFDNLDFDFPNHGTLSGDTCIATIELPNYHISRIVTGQFVPGKGRVWQTDIDDSTIERLGK